MRIALVSDIHGNLAALEAVVADIERRAVDQVANLGDSLSGPLLPLETARFLMAQNWIHLAGNHERQILEVASRPGCGGRSDKYAFGTLSLVELDWLRSLPSGAMLPDGVLLCHGSPHSDCITLLQTAERAATSDEIGERLGDARADVIACGHSHIARSVRTGRGTLIVNPGSAGQPAYADEYPHPHHVETGSPDARYAIVEQRDGQWLAELISVPYDARPMARLAQSRGMPDVAHALLTGYMPANT
ncbi:metallophosphoesterase [Duganella sp. FT94W]|uniref:Metallophosphoesterase n=1 Tax=Duganella lactea TaxID=2692173 RepID=A0ABW9V8T4_9BURK|nr:metallophosphoesterase family protein [Duganella lactea]MYM35172.1 metallophosphoesterase [Duganella lactea]